jgi:hypothetical protein
MARHRRPLLTPSSIREEQEEEQEETPLVFLFGPRPPNPGTIRCLHFSPRDTPWYLMRWTYTDMSLTKWITKIDKIADLSRNRFPDCVYPESYQEEARALFFRVQRERWLARWVIMRWRHHMWSKRTQCNVDLIDMGPVADRDAIHLTDTKSKQIYRFHRRDIIQNFMSNICMSDEMLPMPRPPTNPWTNEPLTLGQLIALSQQIAADYTRRGSCPPTLFAAFWAARFNIKRFREENSALLAQHATMEYFKDLTPENTDVIYDTMMQLLDEAYDPTEQYSPVGIRRWLTLRPLTPQHRSWLRLVRDYTLYINLHVQIRPHWYSTDWIHRDVRALFNATTFPNPRPERLRLAAAAPVTVPMTTSQFIASMVLGPTLPTPPPLPPPSSELMDLSGADALTITALLELLQGSVFRL